MTFIYKEKNETKKDILKNNHTNISIIINDRNNFNSINNWFKGSRERGLR